MAAKARTRAYKKRAVSRTRAPASVSFFPPSVVVARAHWEAQEIARIDREQREAVAAVERKKLIESRAAELLDVRDRLLELRGYVKGFDHYDLRKLERLTSSQIGRIVEVSKNLRVFTSGPHIRVPIPKNNLKRLRALKNFTRQDPKPLKYFILATEDPDHTKIAWKNDRLIVRLDYGSKRKPFDRQFFLYEDYARRPPVTLKSQRRVLKKMMADLPEGNYTFWSPTTGSVGEPVSKQFLMQKLNDWYLAYEPPSRFAKEHEGFGRVLTGVAFMGSGKFARALRNKQRKLRTVRQRSNVFFRRELRNESRRVARRRMRSRKLSEWEVKALQRLKTEETNRKRRLTYKKKVATKKKSVRKSVAKHK